MGDAQSRFACHTQAKSQAICYRWLDLEVADVKSFGVREGGEDGLAQGTLGLVGKRDACGAIGWWD